MKIVLFLVLLLPSFALAAAGFSIDWRHPTRNTDDTEIPERGSDAIKQTRLEWGNCSPDKDSIVGESKVKPVFAPATTTVLHDDGMEPGNIYCVRAFTENCAGYVSESSKVIYKAARPMSGAVPQDPEFDGSICSA